jgi:hypothetical protein
MTVVELAGAPIEDTSAIDHVVTALTQGSKVKVDIPHHIGAVYGRQLSIDRSDGSHSLVAVCTKSRELRGRLAKVLGLTSCASNSPSISNNPSTLPRKRCDRLDRARVSSGQSLDDGRSSRRLPPAKFAGRNAMIVCSRSGAQGSWR